LIARTRDARVEGIDVAAAAVAKAQIRGIPARVQDLDADPRLPEGFDYILLVEVLEHLRWPHRVLLEAVRRARKAVIVTVPNSGWFVYRMQMAFGHAPVQSFTHLHFWTVTDFVAFCHRLGLPTPEVRAVSSARSLRRFLVTRWTNLFAQQVAYRLPGGAEGGGLGDGAKRI
jgi:SAM-dependent methyltransferase